MPTDTQDAHGLAARLLAVSLLAGGLLAGCKEEKKTAAPAPLAPGLAERVRAATEQNIRASRSYTVSFRGILVWSQAAPQKWAICGQVTPFQDSPDTFVPFVSVATITSPADDAATQYQFEHRIGATTSEASRVYAGLVAFCYDKGGPSAGSMRGVPPLPPLPDAVPDPKASAARPEAAKMAIAKPGAEAAQPSAPADTIPASGEVTMRQAANLRTDPHGSTIRVLPQGTPLHVFGQAAGGWYQVGDTVPWGWVHESMLSRKAP